MDFGRRLADPIMQHTVVKQLFFSPRGHGRFSLHTVRYDARAVHSNVTFFHVFSLPTDGILIPRGALFGWQIGLPKREHSKPDQNVQREKRTPNLSIPLGPASKWLNIADKCSTMFASSKNCAKVEEFIKIVTKNIIFLDGKFD